MATSEELCGCCSDEDDAEDEKEVEEAADRTPVLDCAVDDAATVVELADELRAPTIEDELT